MPFIPHTEQDVSDMLDVIGVATVEDLFSEISQTLRQADISAIPSGINEMELTRLMKVRASLDAGMSCFIGAGAYEHYVPAVVWEIASRGEFLTSYTPYQAEASQGTLQLLYEYQTMMASLMGLEVSNASLYDGATALAEAVLMAVRANRHTDSSRILFPKTVHPLYREVVKTIIEQGGMQLVDVDYDGSTGKMSLAALNAIEGEFAALIIPQPNFFGVLEEVDVLTDWAHSKKALAIAVVNPLSMSLLKPPGQWGLSGADIACGEGQPLGVPLASGGPYYGFLCCKQTLIRQLPGRIVGRTVDAAGQEGFVLTLQAREQHIRRAKATSNICTNQGLLVTASTIFMSLLGPEGLRRAALASHQNTTLLREQLLTIKGVTPVFTSPFFHEFVIQLSCPVPAVMQALAAVGIQGGFDISAYYPELGHCLLICVTETKTQLDLTNYATHLAFILSQQTELQEGNTSKLTGGESVC